MSRVCQVTGKGTTFGNNVSHAKNRTRSESRWVRLRVSSKGIRIIDKKGIDTVLQDLRATGVKV